MIIKPISRRTALRGMGVSLALPWLEVMTPGRLHAGSGAGAGADAGPPKRLAFVYVPNGKNMEDWTPDTEGEVFGLKAILQPLEPLRDRFSVLSGLAADKANPNGDGNGDHARAMSAFLTGAQPRKTPGADIRAGVSADQVAAARLGHFTRLPSLEIGCEPVAVAGDCDAGYACVYTSALSWRSATQPLPKEIDPKLVFHRLFVDSQPEHLAHITKRRRSILDFVRADSADLSSKLSANDRRKLDEYFTSIRELELRMDRAEKFPPVARPDYFAPEGIPESFEEHIKLMCDLLVLAFQADVTRVWTFVIANELSNRPYPFINVSDGHHDLSHHMGSAEKKAKIRKINTFHIRQLAYLLEKLDSIREGEGTLLDHCMLVYGSGNADGNRHEHDDLPILVAGGGCGTLKQGRHIRYPEGTPLNNLWLSLLDRMDSPVDQLGDSTGRLPRLDG